MSDAKRMIHEITRIQRFHKQSEMSAQSRGCNLTITEITEVLLGNVTTSTDPYTRAFPENIVYLGFLDRTYRA